MREFPNRMYCFRKIHFFRNIRMFCLFGSMSFEVLTFPFHGLWWNLKDQKLIFHWYSKCVCNPKTSPSPGCLLEMHLFSTYHRPTESEFLGIDTRSQSFKRWFLHVLKFRKKWSLKKLLKVNDFYFKNDIKNWNYWNSTPRG